MTNDWALLLTLLRAETNNLRSLRVDLLPISVCGLLSSLLPPIDSLALLRAALSHRLRTRLTPDWLQSGELAEICAALDGLHTYNPDAITGSDIAAFVQRLLQAEATVGGPYRDNDGSVHTVTNAFIAQCLAWAAEPLPNVSALLASIDQPFGTLQITAAEKTLLVALRPIAESSKPLHAKRLRSHSKVLLLALQAQIVASAPVAPDPQHIDARQHIAQSVYEQAQQLNLTQEPLASKIQNMLKQVVVADSNHEIAELASLYARARRPKRNAAKQKLLKDLGLANVYAWAAYTIYDDFLDNEGDPTLLATGNYLFRSMVSIYQEALPKNAAFQDFVEQTLTTIEAANTCETTYFRFQASNDRLTISNLPDYGEADLLADRALFHIMGPMGVLAVEGEPVEGPVWHATLQALRHYLIARQLNDDIHDWAADLQNGHASYAVVTLLRHLGITPGSYSLETLLPHAQQTFWQDVLPQICDTAITHIAAARQIPMLEPRLFEQSQLRQLFDNVEASMQAARQQRTQSYELMQHLHLG